MRTLLADTLTAATRGQGVASVAATEKAGAKTQAYWTPESAEEPVFLAYSITKTFTAALVLKLAEKGQLNVDDRLARWFPQISHAEQISLRQLLSHTAGIPDYGGLRAYHDAVRTSPSTPWSFERFAAETFDKGLLFAPGEGWAYSNPGYMLLKRILEKVAGTSFSALVAERIARPLGLLATFVPETIGDLATLAPGKSSALTPDRSLRDVRRYYHPGWVSHGVIASRASDIVRFFDGLFAGHLLSQQSLDQMMELMPVPDEPPPNPPEAGPPSRYGKPSYGLGLMGDPVSPWGLIVGHNGGGPCYSASVFRAADVGGATVCAMGAIEADFSAESVVFDVLDQLSAPGAERRTPSHRN